MIYICEHCGASFNEREIEQAVNSVSHAVRCGFCANVTVIDQARPTLISQAYDCLTRANFAEAHRLFGIAIESAPGSRTLTEAYLGALLAAYQVQTIFESDDEIRSRYPKLVLCEYNSAPVGSNALYRRAMQKIAETMDYNAEAKLRYYVGFIVGVQEKYEHQNNASYDICIAYDNTGVSRAIEIKNKLLDHIPNERIYMAGVDSINTVAASGEDGVIGAYIEKVAKNLYARDHSRGMVVVSDSDVLSTRLTTLYTGFFRKKGESDRALCFALGNNMGVMLPNQNYASHVFEFRGVFDDYTACINFLCGAAGILAGDTEDDEANMVSDGEHESQVSAKITMELRDENNVVAVIGADSVRFGVYPQIRINNPAILGVFRAFGCPDATDNKGWSVLFKDSSDRPYTWIRDEYIDGEKYRGVYFTKFREQGGTAVRGSVVPQREAGLGARMITCYKFEPIDWKILKKNDYAYQLAADSALDSMPMEFGIHDEFPIFLTDWLDETFTRTAFTECELDSIYRSKNEERVFLMNREDMNLYRNQINGIACTDYCVCMGVLCQNRGARYCWIHNDNQNCFVYDSACNNTYAYRNPRDNQVAVVPKIIINGDIVRS